MPTYEYECTQCGRLFEIFHSMKDRPMKSVKTDCRECNNKAPVARRIGTGGAVIFRGSGFYETDYRSKGYQEAAKRETEQSSDGKKSSDKKSDSKNDAATPAPKSKQEATGSSKPSDANKKSNAG